MNCTNPNSNLYSPVLLKLLSTVDAAYSFAECIKHVVEDLDEVSQTNIIMALDRTAHCVTFIRQCCGAGFGKSPVLIHVVNAHQPVGVGISAFELPALCDVLIEKFVELEAARRIKETPMPIIWSSLEPMCERKSLQILQFV